LAEKDCQRKHSSLLLYKINGEKSFIKLTIEHHRRKWTKTFGIFFAFSGKLVRL
jgi:hypothetical protein